MFIYYLCIYVRLTPFSSLKSEYVTHLKALGSTGAGLDPCMVTKGTPIANLIGLFLFLLHSTWIKIIL